jgi:hypothetical protein
MGRKYILIFITQLFLFTCRAQIVAPNSLSCDSINYLQGFGYSASQLRNITGLEVTPSNKLWISFAQIGLGYFDGSSWSILNSSNTNNQLPNDSIHCMFYDANDVLWLVNNLGVTRKDQNGFKTYLFTSPMNIVTNPIKDISGLGSSIYLATNSGVLVLDTISSNWQSFNSTNSTLLNDTVNSFFLENNAEIWAANNGGVTKFSNNTIDLSIQDIPGNIVKYFAVTPFDTLFASGNGALYRKYNSDYLNLDSIYFNQKITTYLQWCDSTSLGELIPNNTYDPQQFISNFEVNTDNDIYLVRKGERFSYFNITSITHEHRYLTAGCSYFLYGNSTRDYLTFYGDSILIASKFTNSTANYFLRKFETHSEGNYREYDLSSITSSAGSSNFDFSIPKSYVGSNQSDLNANLINARILNRGDLHFDPISEEPFYQVPINSGKVTSYASAIWLGGYDSSGNLFTAAQTYRHANSSDFIPGPLNVNGHTDSLASQYFDHIWMTRKTDIDEFRYQFALGNVQSGLYVVPSYILKWPAFYNDVNFQNNLAPFVDFNGDQLYNPYDGDYPDIKGDQMAWFIFNDDCPKTETGSNTMGLEIHGTAYGYYCNDGHDALSKLLSLTTFYHYDVYNRSQIDYDSCRFGMWSDFDLGNAADDFVGCDINANSFYCYNGDSLDEGFSGYGICSPIQNIQFLSCPEAPLNDGVDNNHDGFIDEANEQLGLTNFLKYPGNNLFTDDPSNKFDFYNYLSGKWLDGQSVTFGGDGRGSGTGATSIPCNYMFPDTTDSNFGSSWTMSSANLLPNDMKGIGSVGPFNLPSGGKRSFDLAFISGPHDLLQNNLLVKQLGELFRSGQIEQYNSNVIVSGNTQIHDVASSYQYSIPNLGAGAQVIWSINNGLILSGQGTSSITVSWGLNGVGEIKAEIIDSLLPCKKIGKLVVEIGTTNMNEIAVNLAVRIYPNPTSSIIQIESEINHIATIRVIDLNGRVIDDKEYDGTYDSSNLCQGIYVLELIGENSLSLVRKMFIKQ